MGFPSPQDEYARSLVVDAVNRAIIADDLIDNFDKVRAIFLFVFIYGNCACVNGLHSHAIRCDYVQVWRRAIRMYVGAIVEELEEDKGMALFEKALSANR